MMLVAANTTCRPCEISGLQLGRDSPRRPWPYMMISRGTTKTDAGERSIPLNRVAQLAIRQLLDRAYKLGAEKPEHYLLPAELSRHTKPTDPLYARRFQGFDPNFTSGPGRRPGASCARRQVCRRAVLSASPHIDHRRRRGKCSAGSDESIGRPHGRKDDRLLHDVRDNPKAKAVAAIEASNPSCCRSSVGAGSAGLRADYQLSFVEVFVEEPFCSLTG